MAQFEDEADLKARFVQAFRRLVTGRSPERHPAASLDFFYALAGFWTAQAFNESLPNRAIPFLISARKANRSWTRAALRLRLT